MKVADSNPYDNPNFSNSETPEQLCLLIDQ